VKADLDGEPRKMLKAARLYRTQCRVAILKVLIGANKPLKQEQISHRLGDRRFNKVSIYRTLAILLEAGLVHKAFVGQRAWYFELADNCTQMQCHPHFTCTNCGSTHCLAGISLPLARIPHEGFVIHRQQVRLEGLCPACA